MMSRPGTFQAIGMVAVALAMLTASCARGTQKGAETHSEEGNGHKDGEVHKEGDDHAHAEGHEEKGSGESASAERVEMSAEVRAASGIEVQSAEPRRIRTLLELPGEIVPNADRLAHIVPRFPGIARKVHKSIGQHVRHGEVLAVIEGNQSLSTYEVSSLISGTVIEKHVTLGEFVRDDSDIYVVADLSSVWVNVSVYSRDLARVRRGQTALIGAVGSQVSAQGRIDYVGPVVGEATRAASARVVLGNADHKWRPGTFVTARIVVDDRPATIAVPDAAVQQLRGKDHVFVEVDGGFVAREITRGATDGEWTEILSGLRPGERFASRGGFILKSELQKSEASHDH
ncbi:MAG: efflux RND transporter periplasmic adaptor subunit [Candidatus Eisenbacteria bacterium]